MLISIITPTYNRGSLLRECFSSLVNQTNLNFEWIVIDDGSTDQTEEIIQKISQENHQFPIYYYKKKNGGKHTALNFAMSKVNGNVCCILDSDDVFIPDAIQKMIDEWSLYYDNQKIGVISFLRGYNETEAIVGNVDDEKIISNHIDYRINGGVKGDLCETIRTTTFKEFPFPVFKEERFFSEGWLWTNVGLKYQTVYVNKIIYITEYRDDGLTRAGRALRLKSPKAGMMNSYLQMDEKINLKYRIKQAILYNVYSFRVAKYERNKIIRQRKNTFLICMTKPISFLILNYWKKRFL